MPTIQTVLEVSEVEKKHLKKISFIFKFGHGHIAPVNHNGSMSLRDELLKTLSFYEPMSLEMIFLDFDQDYLMENPSLTTEDLVKELRVLEKVKKVKKTKDQGQLFWTRIYPRKPWYKRLFFIPFK